MLALAMTVILAYPDPNSKPDPVRQLARSTCVRVMNPKQGANGSGVVIASRGGLLYVLTAAHVIVGADKLEVSLPPDKDGKVRTVAEVEVVARETPQDLALLRVAAGGVEITPILPAAPHKDEDEEKDFEAVSAGYAEAREPEVRAERVLAKKLLRRANEDCFVWECRERPDTGRSGGALLDKTGKLIGICSGTQDGRGYYCHVDEVRYWLKKQNHAWLWQDGAENGKK